MGLASSDAFFFFFFSVGLWQSLESSSRFLRFLLGCTLQEFFAGEAHAEVTVSGSPKRILAACRQQLLPICDGFSCCRCSKQGKEKRGW